MTNNEYKLIAFAFLSKEAHWNVNKNLCKIVGVESALIMADLISKNDYFEKNNMLQKDGSFFNTNENISQDTSLSIYSVKEGIKRLKQKKFISVVRAGMPSRNHFLIHFSALIDEISQLANFQPTSWSNVNQQVGEFSANINNNKEEEQRNKILKPEQSTGYLDNKVEMTDKEKGDYYVDKFNKTVKLDEKDRSFKNSDQIVNNLKKILKKDYKLADIFRAVRSAMSDEYHVKTKYKYLTPLFFLRQDKLEMHLNAEIENKRIDDQITKVFENPYDQYGASN